MPTPGVPFRVRGRQTSGPNSQPMIPRDLAIGNTVSVTGSVTSTITGTVIATTPTSSVFSTAQVTVTGSATLIFATVTNSVFREVINPTASNAMIAIGVSTVTFTTGHFIPAGAAFSFGYMSGAVYAVAATGSVTVSTIGW